MPLEPVDDEQQARLCGRARAKEIFQPMRWKRIGALPDEAAKLYENARRRSTSGCNSYSLRARSDTSKRKKGEDQEQPEQKQVSSVPSLLHLYRPVSAPTFAARRHDFRAERLAEKEFSITYIVQEVQDEQQDEQGKRVTLEVVLTSSVDPRQEQVNQDDDKAKELLEQRKQRLRHDALCLTRLEPFIDAYRQEKKSFVTATADYRRATMSGRPDLSNDDESAVAMSMRTRRAQTVAVEEAKPKTATRSTMNFITPLSVSAPKSSLYSTSTSLVEEKRSSEEEVEQQQVPRQSSYRTPKIQFVQLKTPEPDYELDFSWYNIYPKAPIKHSVPEKARAKYVEVTGLKVNAHSLVFLRHDAELEELARHVLEIATQWHGCSINIVGSFEVYCLVTSSNKPVELDLDDELLELEASPVTVDDVVPREESVSAYAVHHDTPFFVSEMEHDLRFRAHPLHTDQGAISLLSFPIYSSGADASGSNNLSLSSYCVATLDLWKRDHVPASSHVSQEWMSSMDELLSKISARLEALAQESHAFLKPRSRAGHSIGSSCDSRGSTRRADSIDIELDLYDIDSESAVDSPPLSQAETMDRLTNLSYAKRLRKDLTNDFADIEGSHMAPGGNFWVAKVDMDGLSKIVGIVGLQRRSKTVGEVRRLFVDPSSHRMGVGRKLMAQLESWSKMHGIQSLFLTTNPKKKQALEFYTALGYDRVDETVYFWENLKYFQVYKFVKQL
ncbi:hypothetical protein BBO99_00004265 [Phytophthora kernoviae]|uniref:N-acetyltransferase domain-containing protein n=1 Tax=Phytophthora kernoviae TaxID=325452 RepID=A0A421GRQ8_9STRA|nr:hypothetical protein BBI17_004409 [Phytophthora kernoviae]RLN80765.1 hypothetical protein BBO99_00004265 [Phytophthora kernoviae]